MRYDWDVMLQDFITKADEDTVVPGTMCIRCIHSPWPQRNGFTVIGDAAHAMWDAVLFGRSPWAG